MKNLFIFLCLCLGAFSPSEVFSQEKTGTITIDCPQMPVYRRGIGIFEAQELYASGSIVIDGKSTDFQLTFPKCNVYRTGFTTFMVDAVTAVGTLSDGSKISVDLPPEPVVRRGFSRIAVAITATGTITTPDGKVGQIIVVFPDCRVSRTGIGSFMAEPIVAEGTVVFPKD